MKINVTRRSDIPVSRRVRQLGGMFDVPVEERAGAPITWKGDLPIEDEPWQVGLIVGPSGCGKTTLASELFGEPRALTWDSSRAVIDDFDESLTMEQITSVCQAVGFNTIPAWMRPYGVLSNGERFRVELARLLVEGDGLIVCDEFTSVVDRQVARIGSHAVQRYIRRREGRQFVAVSCHHDIIDWLQPDWIFEPDTMTYTRRRLVRRPSLDAVIAQVPHSTWQRFAPYHYMSASLHNAARCFALIVDDQPVSFAGLLYRHHPRVDDIVGVSRVVTLPDWQGLGLAMILIDTLGAAYRAIGMRLHNYPAHPSFIRSHDRSPHWSLEQRPGRPQGRLGKSAKARMGTRLCATFRYAGEAMPLDDARQLLAGASFGRSLR